MQDAPKPEAVQRPEQPAPGCRVHRVEVKPALLQWACERSGRSKSGPTPAKLEKKFPKLEAWKQGKPYPTFKQLENFAKATRTPIGYLFLLEPPEENLPVTDFRTRGDAAIGQPSPDLLDTLYLCQRRQDWYRDDARTAGDQPLGFVGSLTTNDDIVSSAASIRDAINFDVEQRRQENSWTGALRQFIAQVDASGILVMVSGVVGNNTSRGLDPEEFHGFALVDPLAPLIFINGADSKAAQSFTLAHEVAHIWLGQSGVSNTKVATAPDPATERWCNQVAAELLVPSELVHDVYDHTNDLNSEIKRLARRFKVSTLVSLRRIHDVGKLDEDEFWTAWQAEVERLKLFNKGSGGNYYHSVNARTGARFARALAVSTLEGRTTFTEAMHLLSMKKVSTFMNFAQILRAGF